MHLVKLYFSSTFPIKSSYFFTSDFPIVSPTELQLNKANSSDTEAPFLDFNLSITNDIVSSKFYDIRDDFNFEKVNFPCSSLSFLWCIYFSAYSFC